MRRIVATLLVGLLLFVPALECAPRLDRVQQLYEVDLDEVAEPICTVSAVQLERFQLWVGAGHCVTLTEEGGIDFDVKYRIGEHPAMLHSTNSNKDLAAWLMPRFHASDAFTVSEKHPKLLDEVRIYGFPYGWPTLFASKGVVSVVGYESGDGFQRLLYSLPTAPGLSGSPVVDKGGKLVSVHQIGFRGSNMFGSVGGGAMLNDLRLFLGLSEVPV